jgi:hypothetical protein
MINNTLGKRVDFFQVRSKEDVIVKQKKRKRKLDAQNKVARARGELEETLEVFENSPNDEFVWKQV